MKAGCVCRNRIGRAGANSPPPETVLRVVREVKVPRHGFPGGPAARARPLADRNVASHGAGDCVNLSGTARPMSRQAKKKAAKLSPTAAPALAPATPASPPAAPAPAVIRNDTAGSSGAGPFWSWLLGAGLIVAVLLAYWPALRGDFIFDDDLHIYGNPSVRSAAGLGDIWFAGGATPQYYPLSFTFFWLGYRLWGLNTLGYHLLNVLLHGTAAVLLWQVLQRLKVRGAWLAGAIFALHPVCVMSVAWMTELKNVLSASLALGAAWAYLRAAGLGVYERNRGESKWDWRYYALSLVLFQLALFAKTAVSFLPVTLLLIAWWRGRRMNWPTVWPVLPMLAMAVGVGLVTIYVERNSGGASGAPFQIPPLERILISGRSFWFYLGKLFFPYHLTFLYERWSVTAGAWWQYLFPAAMVGLLAGLWGLRGRIGKGAFVAALHFFVATSPVDFDCGALLHEVLVCLGPLAVFWCHERDGAGGGGHRPGAGSFEKGQSAVATVRLRNSPAGAGRADLAAMRHVRQRRKALAENPRVESL